MENSTRKPTLLQSVKWIVHEWQPSSPEVTQKSVHPSRSETTDWHRHPAAVPSQTTGAPRASSHLQQGFVTAPVTQINTAHPFGPASHRVGMRIQPEGGRGPKNFVSRAAQLTLGTQHPPPSLWPPPAPQGAEKHQGHHSLQSISQPLGSPQGSPDLQSLKASKSSLSSQKNSLSQNHPAIPHFSLQPQPANELFQAQNWGLFCNLSWIWEVLSNMSPNQPRCTYWSTSWTVCNLWAVLSQACAYTFLNKTRGDPGGQHRTVLIAWKRAERSRRHLRPGCSTEKS